jgi:hypothetical protein
LTDGSLGIFTVAFVKYNYLILFLINSVRSCFKFFSAQSIK